ncbi:MAG TPA: response regulator [Turneriella sp.]|nr:response regulator [Turneriella sp.]HNE19379.1 response regulator [Turneriella sp.]HNL10029.1 response regulator [Turneriella sp.]HNN00168.1 response regulator [Turneriella sp.]
MAQRVLVVDDSQLMRQIIAGFLSANGFAIAGEARDGVEALKLAEAVQPDLVTLDIGLPQLGGITVLQKIKEVSPATRVMVVSAIHDKSLVLQALEAGAADFLHKPISEDLLVESARRLTSQPAA